MKNAILKIKILRDDLDGILFSILREIPQIHAIMKMISGKTKNHSAGITKNGSGYRYSLNTIETNISRGIAQLIRNSCQCFNLNRKIIL